jgi:diguanylate cyclase (GGDEF)-like protein
VNRTLPPFVAWTLPEGALLAAAALVATSDALYEPALRLAPFFAAVVAGLALLIGIRFQRARVAFAAVTLVLADRALALLTTGSAPEARALFQIIAVLLPLNLALLPWTLERGVLTPAGLARLGAIAGQAAAALVAARALPHTTLAVLDPHWLPERLTTWSAVGDVGLAAFGIAGLVLAASLAFDAGPARRPWVWALAASFLALQGAHPGPAPTIYFATATLMLVIAAIEASFVMAYHDGLTGLPARRALTEALQRVDGRFAVAMVDVDHFKRLNDRHGHDTGDQVLRMVGAHLARVQDGGRAFRYGGEEFTLLFPGRAAADVVPELERLRAEIAAAEFGERGRLRPRARPARPRARKSALRLRVTVSIGVAEGSGAGDAAALERADRALYRAKDGGRNQVSD